MSCLRHQKVRYPKGHEPRFRIRHRNSRGDWEWGAGSADTSVLYRRDEIDEEIALGGGGGDMDDAIPF
jgi:hypothetical protein